MPSASKRNLSPKPPEAKTTVADATAIAQGFTTVNGMGLWKSWTRNFRTPLLAMLDLIDNAIDAALQNTGEDQFTGPSDQEFNGRIHIVGDKYTAESSGDELTTGVCLINNSCRPIKPLDRILEVYSSSGKEGHDSIGENGVGLKQGCATLTNLSFVLVKSGGVFSLGVISQKLQRPEGCCLPSFRFKSPQPDDDLRNEMYHVFTEEEQDVGACVTRYGGGSLEAGLDRLISRYVHLSGYKENNDDAGNQSDWENDEHVFCVVIHAPEPGYSISKKNKLEAVEPEVNNESDEDETFQQPTWERASLELMDELSRELPINYIHIPPIFDVRVDGQPVKFLHWQRRLVEPAVFYVHIDENEPWDEADNEVWRCPVGSHPTRVFLGFDPVRLADPKKMSTLALHIYSRSSGRLIKSEEDGRPLLGLGTGGTQFGQGLTVLVDDALGRLPLNPTKQDIAFGERSNGNVHKKNLYIWVAAVANFYWTLQFERCGDRKKALTDRVIFHAHNENATIIPDNDMKPLDSCDYIQYSNVRWYRYRAGNSRSIRVKDKKQFEERIGVDAVRRLARNASNQPTKGPKRQAAKTSGGQRKRGRPRLYDEPTNVDEDILLDDTIQSQNVNSSAQGEGTERPKAIRLLKDEEMEVEQPNELTPENPRRRRTKKTRAVAAGRTSLRKVLLGDDNIDADDQDNDQHANILSSEFENGGEEHEADKGLNQIAIEEKESIVSADTPEDEKISEKYNSSVVVEEGNGYEHVDDDLISGMDFGLASAVEEGYRLSVKEDKSQQDFSVSSLMPSEALAETTKSANSVAMSSPEPVLSSSAINPNDGKLEALEDELLMQKMKRKKLKMLYTESQSEITELKTTVVDLKKQLSDTNQSRSDEDKDLYKKYVGVCEELRDRTEAHEELHGEWQAASREAKKAQSRQTELESELNEERKRVTSYRAEIEELKRTIEKLSQNGNPSLLDERESELGRMTKSVRDLTHAVEVQTRQITDKTRANERFKKELELEKAKSSRLAATVDRLSSSIGGETIGIKDEENGNGDDTLIDLEALEQGSCDISFGHETAGMPSSHGLGNDDGHEDGIDRQVV